MLNEKWRKFRIGVVGGLSAATAIGIGIWTTELAYRVRGYAAVGSEWMLTIASAVFVGIVAHKILDRIEAQMVGQMIAESEARKAEEELRIRRSRMFLIGPEPKRQRTFTMYSMEDAR